MTSFRLSLGPVVGPVPGRGRARPAVREYSLAIVMKVYRPARWAKTIGNATISADANRLPPIKRN